VQTPQTSSSSSKVGNASDSLAFEALPEKVATNSPVLEDISFDGGGCSISQASASFMTDLLKGKTVIETQELFTLFHKLVTVGASMEEKGKALNAETIQPKISSKGRVILSNEDEACVNEKHYKANLEPKNDMQEKLGMIYNVFGNIHRFPSRVKCASLAWHTLMSALSSVIKASEQLGEQQLKPQVAPSASFMAAGNSPAVFFNERTYNIASRQQRHANNGRLLLSNSNKFVIENPEEVKYSVSLNYK
jgi:NifU-like protein involved in Fe-S cluster formation